MTNKKRHDWEWDEYVLVLDLYVRNRQSPPKQNNDKISKISSLLNQRADMYGIDAGSRYRSNNSVYMRMMNFWSIDERINAKGLKPPPPLGKKVFREFNANPEKFRGYAEAIRHMINRSR